jgi:hypothetical protein
MSTRRLAAITAVMLVALGTTLRAEPVLTNRSWVSGMGDDANSCSRASPCRTFAGAESRTVAGGEISVLDAGGFGGVTINKSISIVSEGAEGGIITGATNGITVNAGPQDVVSLHGLFIEGLGSGLKGIRIVSAGSVYIRKCMIRGMTQAGIAVELGAEVSVFVSDCTLTSNQIGLTATAGSTTVQVFLDRVQIVRNKLGIHAENTRAVVHLNNSVVAQNVPVGLETVNGARIVSFGNNALLGGGSDPSSSVPLR